MVVDFLANGEEAVREATLTAGRAREEEVRRERNGERAREAERMEIEGNRAAAAAAAAAGTSADAADIAADLLNADADERARHVASVLSLRAGGRVLGPSRRPTGPSPERRPGAASGPELAAVREAGEELDRELERERGGEEGEREREGGGERGVRGVEDAIAEGGGGGRQALNDGNLYRSPRRHPPIPSSGPPPPSRPAPPSLSPAVLRLAPPARSALAARLALLCRMSPCLCEHALAAAGDSEEDAREWLEAAGSGGGYGEYREGGRGIYEEVLDGLRFERVGGGGSGGGSDFAAAAKEEKPAAEGTYSTLLVDAFLDPSPRPPLSVGSGEGEAGLQSPSSDPASSSMSLTAALLGLTESVAVRVGGDDGSGERELGGESFAATSFSQASPFSSSSNPSLPPSQGFAHPSELLLTSISSTLTSHLHKTIGVVICTECTYLEFPGCGAHKMLLSVEKRKGAAKCSRCSCATDTHGPWNQGCRICLAPTKVDFWNLSTLEAQSLLRGMPPSHRTAEEKETPCKLKVLKCQACGVAGFPGVCGTMPLLAVSSSQGDFCVAEGAGGTGPGSAFLEKGDLEKSMRHLDGCGNGGGALEAIECGATMEEAK